TCGFKPRVKHCERFRRCRRVLLCRRRECYDRKKRDNGDGNSRPQPGDTFMRPIRSLSVALPFMFGCQAMPTVTRTGDVKDIIIIIGDNLSPAEIVVGAGDEVRWIN